MISPKATKVDQQNDKKLPPEDIGQVCLKQDDDFLFLIVVVKDNFAERKKYLFNQPPSLNFFILNNEPRKKIESRKFPFRIH